VNADRWPCSTCGAPGVKNLGTAGYCRNHLDALYRTFDPAVFHLRGVGLLAGAVRPDYGPGYGDLACVACGATWTGVIGEPCWWCETMRAAMLKHQAELVLRPPDIDPTDKRYNETMTAWADRMVRACRAGIITRDEGQRVWSTTIEPHRAA
jgi:hypothetical protein